MSAFFCLPFFVQKVRRIEKGFFYQRCQNSVVGFFRSLEEMVVADLFYYGKLLADVLDRGSALQQLAGSNVHLYGREAPDLEVLRDKVVGFLVVFDGGEPDIAIDELLIDDAVSQLHGEAIKL